jgi:hemoglobin
VSPSLYQRLGGAAGLATIADNAVDRHAANPTLAARFRGQDLPQLKTLSVSFLSAGTGGPLWAHACGAPAAHAGMRFSDAELAAVVDDLAAALVDQGVGAAEIGEVIGLFQALERDSRAAIGNDSGTSPA